MRKGYVIDVKSHEGVGAVFIFYMQNIADTMTIEAVKKVSIAQMITAAEKYSHKTGFLIKSDHVVYRESYKATATKN